MGSRRLTDWVTRIGAIALVLYLGWLAWGQFGPRKLEISPLRRQIVDEVLPAIIEDLRAARGDVRDVVLLHFKNDPSDYITDQLRSAIESAGILTLRDRSLGEKVRQSLSLRQTEFGDLAPALAIGREAGAEAIIVGAVGEFESAGSTARLSLNVQLVESRSGALLMEKAYEREQLGGLLSAAALGRVIDSVPFVQRLLAWLLAVLLLPVFTVGFIRAMVRKESNSTNAFVLGVYTGADALLALLAFGGLPGSWLAGVLVLVGIVGAAAFNMAVMTFALRLET